MELPYMLLQFYFRVYSQENGRQDSAVCIPTFRAACFQQLTAGSNPRVPQWVDKWRNKMWSMHVVDCYAAVKAVRFRHLQHG